jgi:hypothetical protein
MKEVPAYLQIIFLIVDIFIIPGIGYTIMICIDDNYSIMNKVLISLLMFILILFGLTPIRLLTFFLVILFHLDYFFN